MPSSELLLHDPRVRQAVRWRVAKEALDAGDPLPMIELQWPGAVLDDFQVDIVRSFFHGGLVELDIKGCTGAGKGCAVSMATNLWFTLHETCKIIVTAATLDHAKDGIFSEIAAWRRQMTFPGAGTLLKSGVQAHERKYLTLANPETGEGFSGHHGPATRFIFDEATAASDEFYELAQTQAKLIVAIANPRTLSGWFRRGFPRHDPNTTQTIPGRMGPKRCITISGLDCRNVREGKEVIPNQLSKQRFEGIMANPDPQYRRIYGLAEFPLEDAEKQVILPSWLDRHVGGCDQVEVAAFGLDVAASQHGDLTVLAAGGEQGIRALHVWRSANTMEIVGLVLQTAWSYGIDLKRGYNPIMVDMSGIGKGVGDRLREQRVKVFEFVGNGTPDDSAHYRNRRAEGYGELGARLDPNGRWPDAPWRLPNDPLLLEELVAPEKVFGSDALRYGITPKERGGTEFRGETIREQLGRSPDRADAVVYLYDIVRRLVLRRKSVPRITRPLILGDMFPSEDDDWDEIPDDPCENGASSLFFRLLSARLR